MSQWNKETIKTLRKKLGLSQNEFALALGCRQQTISEWEQGIYEPANAYTKLLDMISQSRENIALDQTSWSSPITKEKAKRAMVVKAKEEFSKSKKEDVETEFNQNPDFREFDPAID